MENEAVRVKPKKFKNYEEMIDFFHPINVESDEVMVTMSRENFLGQKCKVEIKLDLKFDPRDNTVNIDYLLSQDGFIRDRQVKMLLIDEVDGVNSSSSKFNFVEFHEKKSEKVFGHKTASLEFHG